MSHSGRITAAGNKISAFVKLKGGNFSKVDEGISKSNEVLKDNESSDGYGDAADATVATLEAVLGSIDNFESRDPTQIAIGVLDILAEVSAFAALTGPQGMVVAAVLGPLCTMISSILGAGTAEAPESDEDMLKRVITEALAVSDFNDLEDTASGVMKELEENMGRVKGYLNMADILGPSDRGVIINLVSDLTGSEFLGKLRSHIVKGIGKDDNATAKRTATLITAYTSVVFVRCQYLYMLSCLIGGDPGAKGTAFITMQLAEKQKASSKELLRPFLKRPDASNHVVYSKVYLQPQSSLNLLQALCEEESEGKMMAIYNTKQKRYLQVESSDAGRSEAKTKTTSIFRLMPSSMKFVVFGRDTLAIFSLEHAGYVYAAEYNPIDASRRRVNGWKKGNQIREGSWTPFVRDGSVGSVYLRNTYFKEYLYAADYGASGETNHVFSWRPGNRVNQGYWIFEDLAPVWGTTHIRSVSSGKYLDGRSTNYPGSNTIYLTAPRSDSTDYFQWELIKLNDGTYNMKSFTSNMYLGGGTAALLAHLTSDASRINSSYKWHIREYTYNGRTKYAIQSVTNKLYLGGMNPDETIGVTLSPIVGLLPVIGFLPDYQGGGLYLTGRDPQNEKDLMWEIDEKAL